MVTKYLDLDLNQNATFIKKIIVCDDNNISINLDNCYITSSFKKSYYSTSIYDLNVNIEDSANGVINIFLDQDVTSTINDGRYLYDILLEKDNMFYRIYEGILTVAPGITESDGTFIDGGDFISPSVDIYESVSFLTTSNFYVIDGGEF